MIKKFQIIYECYEKVLFSSYNLDNFFKNNFLEFNLFLEEYNLVSISNCLIYEIYHLKKLISMKKR